MIVGTVLVLCCVHELCTHAPTCEQFLQLTVGLGLNSAD